MERNGTPQTKFKAIRTTLGLNQKQLSDLLGFHVPTTSRIETGKQIPSLEQAVVIQKKLGIPCEAWVEGRAA